ncbi:unnamed protein product [Rotaria magnacalcarata]|uniref:Uncharacterized protein n=1 Tax=Rotaria magnacalcarata TaxID=392030 RepID=A0A817AX40_9BILA|nr:unnamed protein product [Rotaria magnacalcarata]CAF2264339.1 unnamed protein product [Rotaria magnacalcarata]
MIQGWQLINIQFKTQAEAIDDLYSAVSEILHPMFQSIQALNHAVEEMNIRTRDENETHQRTNTFNTIQETISSLSNRLNLLTNHQQKLKLLMDKENTMLLEGMNSIDQSYNEL